MYFLVLAFLGGLLALFGVAGWTSYSQGKLPEPSTLFRWFTTGLVSAGVSAYVWIFGTGGDPNALIKNVGEALEVNTIMEGLTSAAGGAMTTLQESSQPEPQMTVGMPTF